MSGSRGALPAEQNLRAIHITGLFNCVTVYIQCADIIIETTFLWDFRLVYSSFNKGSWSLLNLTKLLTVNIGG